jgi:hypothetical protein
MNVYPRTATNNNNLKMIGDITNHHDQSILSVNFKIVKIIVKYSKSPINALYNYIKSLTGIVNKHTRWAILLAIVLSEYQ